MEEHRSCQTHCCVIHGCKYGHFDCPVTTGSVEQTYPCEYCNLPSGAGAEYVKYQEWCEDYPTIPGLFYFYGYRYGRDDKYCINPELMLVKFDLNSAGGPMAVADGAFMWKSEIEDAHFKLVGDLHLPKLNKEEEPKNDDDD
jgi:hypothetical protein